MCSKKQQSCAGGKVSCAKVQYVQGRLMVLQLCVPLGVCLLCLCLSQILDFWLHLTSVAVSCCFAVNPLAVPHNLSL